MRKRNVVIDGDTKLSEEEQRIIVNNIEEIRADIDFLKIQVTVPVPKVVGKIDLSAMDASTHPRKRISTDFSPNNSLNVTEDSHSLMAVAKELNIHLDNLIEFLVSRGVTTDDLKPFSILSKTLYLEAKKHFSESGNEPIVIPLGKALVCLNVSIDTFINSLKANNVEFDFKLIKIRNEVQSITLAPEAYISLFKNNNLLSSYKGLKQVRLYFNESVEQNLNVSEYSFAEWNNIKINFFQTGKYKNVSLPNISFIDFALSYGLSHDELRNKLSEQGYNYIRERPEINQKIPLEIFIRYLEIEQKPIAPFIECALNEKQKKMFDRKPTSNQVTTQDIITKPAIQITPRTMHIQKILFGSPGTGKSHTIDGSGNSYLKQLQIVNKSMDCIKTVFHPEYTYGDFMGKLMPNTNDDGDVEYKFYAGHFLQALGRAYKNIVLAKILHEKEKDEVEKTFKRKIDKTVKKDFTELEIQQLQDLKEAVAAPIPQNVALVIDEINRGNSAAIFGTTFQLLDRDANSWSSYHVKISDLENNKLLEEISLEYKEYKKNSKVDKVSYSFNNVECTESEYRKYLEFVFEDLNESEKVDLTRRDIKLPPNLSIIATMNTSDNSIYFMDSAFKRRWDWEFIDITSEEQKKMQNGRKLEDGFAWDEFVDNLNSFIKKYGERIRKIEDKQIGYYFIKGDLIKHEAIKNKLMFFMWDSIFNNDKKPLKELIGMDKTLVTFGDFIRHYDVFISAIKNKTFSTTNVL